MIINSSAKLIEIQGDLDSMINDLFDHAWKNRFGPAASMDRDTFEAFLLDVMVCEERPGSNVPESLSSQGWASFIQGRANVSYEQAKEMLFLHVANRRKDYVFVRRGVFKKVRSEPEQPVIEA